MADEFTVFDTWMERWIENIDQYDGDVSDTADRDWARIFSGAEWREFWTRDDGRYRLDAFATTPTESRP
jgi:hypothetical protein